jgi:hypothetical protein
MRQFEAVILRLTGRTRADEEALTDLLNERARAGWSFHSVNPLSATRAVVVFYRDAS